MVQQRRDALYDPDKAGLARNQSEIGGVVSTSPRPVQAGTQDRFRRALGRDDPPHQVACKPLLVFRSSS